MRWFLLRFFLGYERQPSTPKHTVMPLVPLTWACLVLLCWSFA